MILLKPQLLPAVPSGAAPSSRSRLPIGVVGRTEGRQAQRGPCWVLRPWLAAEADLSAGMQQQVKPGHIALHGATMNCRQAGGVQVVEICHGRLRW
mmetsp:Transcript_69964/g.164170  ORF Transcript_69964/g.164170 Transcript_69964/m.164170 type:complete len:96 (+) Transcript_69964:240-527(+)